MLTSLCPLSHIWTTVPGNRHITPTCTEVHATKLPTRSFCADVNVRGGLDLCSHWVSRTSATRHTGCVAVAPKCFHFITILLQRRTKFHNFFFLLQWCLVTLLYIPYSGSKRHCEQIQYAYSLADVHLPGSESHWMLAVKQSSHHVWYKKKRFCAFVQNYKVLK